MNEKIEKYVHDIFEGYRESQQLNDLKEEIKANLLARIEDSIADGKKEEAAFQEAIKELGDVSEVAEEISLNTKYEVIDQMFNHKPLEKKYAFAYTAAVAVLLFGIISSLIVYFQMGNLFIAVSTLFPFAVVAISAFVYLGLVQETQFQYGMKPLRALLYTLATTLLTSGIFISLIVYLQHMGLNGKIESVKEIIEFHNGPLLLAVSVLIPFVLPAVCIFIFLGLTESDRTKPTIWSNYGMYADEKQMAVYGNLSGALWIFSFGIFLCIGFFIGWKFSWIVFIFTVGFQVLMESYFASKRK